LVALEELQKADRLKAEVKHTLANRGIPPEVVESVLDRLTAWRFLDDPRTVDGRVSRMRRRRLGRARIAAELVQRGAPEDEVASRLNEITDESEIELAASLIREKGKDSPAKAGRFLSNRGFDEETIDSALQRVFHDLEDTA
jgi:SOS response regulatory protein OraA/RecX